MYALNANLGAPIFKEGGSGNDSERGCNNGCKGVGDL